MREKDFLLLFDRSQCAMFDEHFFGRKWPRGGRWIATHGKSPDPAGWIYAGDGDGHIDALVGDTLPAYTLDLDAAGKAVTKLGKEGWRLRLFSPGALIEDEYAEYAPDNEWVAEVERHTGQDGEFYARGGSRFKEVDQAGRGHGYLAGEAIVLAFLKAEGVVK